MNYPHSTLPSHFDNAVWEVSLWIDWSSPVMNGHDWMNEGLILNWSKTVLHGRSSFTTCGPHSGWVPARMATRMRTGTAAVTATLHGCGFTWASPAGSSTPIVTPPWSPWCSSSPRTASSVQVWHSASELCFPLGVCSLFLLHLFNTIPPSTCGESRVRCFDANHMLILHRGWGARQPEPGCFQSRQAEASESVLGEINKLVC